MLGIIIFGIGFTIDASEFKSIYVIRHTVVVATLLRSIVLTTIAYGIGLFFHLSTTSLAGLVIIGTCPGGTAANVMSYLAKGNIALTVVLTFLTTLISPFIMPLLIYLFLHTEITVNYLGMFKSSLLIVFFPLILGMLVKICFPARLKTMITYLPVISIILIALVIACIMAMVSPQLMTFPSKIILAALLLNLSGYLVGLALGRLMHYSPSNTKSLCFEYGMFDVGIGIVIATLFFEPATALPAAIMALMQNLTASFLIKNLRSKQQGFRESITH